MRSIANTTAQTLITYLANQPHTPELMDLVRRLIRLNPGYDKLLDMFVTAEGH
jgi:hypothetical protein